jgi:hypothetical protein
MGYTLAEGKFSATLSRHNSVKDKIHDLLWQDFLERLQYLIEREEYKPISLMFSANEEP